MFVLTLTLLCLCSCNANVSIRKDSMSIINSETLPGNLLPNFLFMQGSIEGGSVGVKIGGGRGTPKPFQPDDSCTDDIFENAMQDMRSPQLPYLTQGRFSSLYNLLILRRFVDLRKENRRYSCVDNGK